MTLVATDGPIEIYIDTHAENPRDWDNLGTFWGFHGRYASPDPVPEGVGPMDLPKDVVYLPVWLYDHSGVSFAAADSNPFHCPWDSGQFGWIFVTKADLRKEFGWKRISVKREAEVKKMLAAEVETYSQWANGDVYGYVDTETVDNCWGFYSIQDAIHAARSERVVVEA